MNGTFTAGYLQELFPEFEVAVKKNLTRQGESAWAKAVGVYVSKVAKTGYLSA